jgi:two-component system, chemotaxis family, chemotaxis protein CheY
MKFLIIDDDVESCQLLEKRLEKFGNSTFAADGKAAYELFLKAHKDTNPFTVIFLDIVMPEINGHEVLVNIRKWEEAHLEPEEATKIVMVSAMKDTKNIFTSVKEGCDNYMTKPIRKQGVIDVMQKLGYADNS